MGFKVLSPIGERSRYDLVVDVGDRLVKMQIKTAQLLNNRLKSCMYSTHLRDGKRVEKRNYIGEVDYIGIYSPDLDSCYIIKPEDAPKYELYLVIGKTKSGQIKNIRFADDFKLNVHSFS